MSEELHVHYTQDGHTLDCHHVGLTQTQHKIADSLRVNGTEVHGDKIVWLDVWSAVDKVTGEQRAMIVARVWTEGDDGEEIRPLAMLTELDTDLDRFDFGSDTVAITRETAEV